MSEPTFPLTDPRTISQLEQAVLHHIATHLDHDPDSLYSFDIAPVVDEALHALTDAVIDRLAEGDPTLAPPGAEPEARLDVARDYLHTRVWQCVTEEIDRRMQVAAASGHRAA